MTAIAFEDHHSTPNSYIKWTPLSEIENIDGELTEDLRVAQDEYPNQSGGDYELSRGAISELPLP
jgi:hypothetical protein